MTADQPRVHRLKEERFRETRGGSFAAFPEDEFQESDAILTRYRIASMETLQQTQKDARAMFMRDLREVGETPIPRSTADDPNFGAFPPDAAGDSAERQGSGLRGTRNPGADA